MRSVDLTIKDKLLAGNVLGTCVYEIYRITTRYQITSLGTFLFLFDVRTSSLMTRPVLCLTLPTAIPSLFTI